MDDLKGQWEIKRADKKGCVMKMIIVGIRRES